MQEALPTDGRTLRSLRTREAIVDATIGLLEEGDLRPTAPRVAERASVSVRSVFQHFDDLETLHASVAERLVDRVAVLVLPVPPDLPLAERLDRFVHQRALLLEAVTPIRRAADVHGPFSPEITARLRDGQAFLRAELVRTFEPELRARRGARATTSSTARLRAQLGHVGGPAPRPRPRPGDRRAGDASPGRAAPSTLTRPTSGSAPSGGPSRRSPMMFFCTWVVPPAMRPPGAPSTRADAPPASIASAPARSASRIAASNISSVTPSLARLAATDATGPCRRPIACSAPPRRDQLGQPVAGDGVVGAVEGGDGVEPPSEGDARGADVAALVGERGHRHAPPAVQRAEQRVVGQADLVEEHLVELAAAGHLAQRADLDARQRHVHQEERDARVARRVGVGAGEEDAAVGDAAVRAPHLLAGDHPVVAVALGPGAEAGQVAAGTGLGEELAPHLLGLEDPAQVRPLLLGRAEGEDRSAGEHDPDHVDPGRDLGDGALGGPGRGVLDREPAPAVLHRPVEPGPARLEQASAARPGPPRPGRAAGSPRSHGALRPGGRPATLGPGLGVVDARVHLHGADGTRGAISGMMVRAAGPDEEC